MQLRTCCRYPTCVDGIEPRNAAGDALDSTDAAGGGNVLNGADAAEASGESSGADAAGDAGECAVAVADEANSRRHSCGTRCDCPHSSRTDAIECTSNASDAFNASNAFAAACFLLTVVKFETP